MANEPDKDDLDRNRPLPTETERGLADEEFEEVEETDEDELDDEEITEER